MTKRKFSSSSDDVVDRRGFWHPRRGIRQFRKQSDRVRRPHFVSSILASMDTGESAATKIDAGRLHHQPHMIPGVDGHRTWGFPNTIITKLRYGSYYAIASNLGARGINVFAANGCYDPDLTNAGHQPMYWDNYTALYDQYVVIGSKITATFAPRTSGLNFMVGVRGDDDSSVVTGIENLLEGNNSVSTLLPALGAGTRTLTMTFEPNECFGVDAIADGSSSTGTGANPTELWCYALWAATSDGASNGTTDVLVEIEYTVRFSELKDPVQS